MIAKIVNRQIVLASRPQGMPTELNFHLNESPVPEPKEGEVLVRAHYLSIDPYMRGRMNERASYVPPFELNHPLSGGVVAEVVESKDRQFEVGDTVLGQLEWSDYSVAQGKNLKKIDSHITPVSAALGALGMPGMTAYFGLLDIGRPQKGETVVVSGAAGAVGMLVGQIAKIKECNVVGIVGSDEKKEYLTQELGFDVAINYKSLDVAEQIKVACPNGVDVYFDNVGGDITDQVMKYINWHARIVVCGQISMYNMEKPDLGPRLFRSLIVKSAMAKGFIVSLDYHERYSEGINEMSKWINEGKIKVRETVVQGLENAPKAFIGLFKGENIGKQIVRIIEPRNGSSR